MLTASELAGFFAAHAIWCVSDGPTLVPMLAYTTEDGQRKVERLAMDDAQAAVAFGRQRLADNEMDANDAVLLYDGRLTLGDRKVDAIVIELRAYFSPDSEAIIGVPYTPKDAPGGFRVHKPKVLVWTKCEDFEPADAFAAFFDGVAAHEKGAEVWNKALDESI